jgi:hypothetical protein
MMRLLLRQHELCLAYDGERGDDSFFGISRSQPNPSFVCTKSQLILSVSAFRNNRLTCVSLATDVSVLA